MRTASRAGLPHDCTHERAAKKGCDAALWRGATSRAGLTSQLSSIYPLVTSRPNLDVLVVSSIGCNIRISISKPFFSKRFKDRFQRQNEYSSDFLSEIDTLVFYKTGFAVSGNVASAFQQQQGRTTVQNMPKAAIAQAKGVPSIPLHRQIRLAVNLPIV